MLSFDKLPDKVVTKVEPGEYVLTILSVEEIVAKTGAIMAQFTYKIEGTGLKLNYDNCVIYKSDGTDNTLGQVKLKRIMTATGVKPDGGFTIKSIAPLLVGKSFKTELVLDRNDKYLEMSSDLDKIQPVTEPVKPTVAPTNLHPVDQSQTIGEEEKTIDTDPIWS